MDDPVKRTEDYYDPVPHVDSPLRHAYTVDLAQLRDSRDQWKAMAEERAEKQTDALVAAEAQLAAKDQEIRSLQSVAANFGRQLSGQQAQLAEKDDPGLAEERRQFNARIAELEAQGAALRAALKQLHLECLDEGHTDSGQVGDICRQRGQVIRCGICMCLDDAVAALTAPPAPDPETGEKR